MLEATPPLENLNPPPLRRSGMSALRWLVAGTLAQRVITVAGMALVARIISEDELGVYRQLLSFHFILFVVLPLGFDQLLVREVAERVRYTQAFYGALIVSSLLIAGAGWIGHDWIARLLDLRQWSALLWLFPAIVLVQAAKLSLKAPLAAELAYRRISIGEALYAFVSVAGGLLLLLIWRHPGALYVAYAAAELVELAYLYQVREGPVFRVLPALNEFRGTGGGHRRFSLFFCADQVLNAAGANAPVLVLGACLSKSAAAGFALANWLLMVPLFLLLGAVGRIAFPTMAGKDLPFLQRRSLDMVHSSAALVSPFLIWVAIMAEPVVHIALGEKWIDQTVPLVQWIGIYCVFVSLCSPLSPVDVLMDRPDVGLWWNAATFILRISALFIGIPYGLVTAVAAYSIVSAVMWIVWCCVLAWLLKCGQWRFHRAWLQLVPLWLFTAAGCWAVMHTFERPIPRLAAGSLVLAAYGILLNWIFPETSKVALRFFLREKSKGITNY